MRYHEFSTPSNRLAEAKAPAAGDPSLDDGDDLQEPSPPVEKFGQQGVLVTPGARGKVAKSVASPPDSSAPDRLKNELRKNVSNDITEPASSKALPMTSKFPRLLAALQDSVSIMPHWDAKMVEAHRANPAKQHAIFCAAAEKLNAAIAAKTITNPALNDIKDDLNRALGYVKVPGKDNWSVRFSVHLLPSMLVKARKAGAAWTDLLEEIVPVAIAMDTIQGKVNGKQVNPTMVFKRQPKAEVKKSSYVSPPASTAAQKKVLDVLEEITQAAYEEMVVQENKHLHETLDRIVAAVEKNGGSLYDYVQARSKEIAQTLSDDKVAGENRDLARRKYDLSNARLMADYDRGRALLVSHREAPQRRPDADAMLLAEATQTVDDRRTFFVGRNLKKLAPIFDAIKSDFTLRNMESSFTMDGFQSELLASYDNKASFRTRMQIVRSYSSTGTPFDRFPITFHNVKLPGGEKMSVPSEERMMKVFVAAF